MKKLLIVLALLVVSSAAHAGRPYYQRIDLTQKFQNTQINLIDDGPSLKLGAEIVLNGSIGQDFIVFTKTRGSVSECKIVSTKAGNNMTAVRVAASTDYDDGSSCFAIVHYKGGKTAVVTMYSTGT